MIIPASVTKSIGLLADAPLSWFLHRHLDSFIVTGQLLPTCRDRQKTRHLDADANSIKPPGRQTV